MRKSIATVSLGGKLTDKLEAIAAAGFDGVEIFEPNLLRTRAPHGRSAGTPPISA
jgi:4-hydroxyphenylpyruvate dioxygenase